jgi:apolipoprotein N-acyltransferase
LISNRVIAFLAAILCGLALALAFDYHAWWLAILALSGLYWLLTNRTVRGLGLAFAVTYLGVHLSWVQVLGAPAWFGLVAVSAVPWLIFELRVVDRSSPLAFASLIVVVEMLRSLAPFGGFPWGLIAYSQLDGPFVQLASLGGTALVSGVVALAASALVITFTHGAKKMIAPSLIFSLLLAATAFSQTKMIGEVSLVAIQGNVPRAGLDAMAQRRAVLENHLAITNEFAHTNTQNADLVVWPENASDIDPWQDAQAWRDINQAVKKLGVPLLVGAIVRDEESGRPMNAGILWQEGAPELVYQKQQLVPFGEYIPARSLLAGLSPELQRIPSDYLAGNKPGVIGIGEATIGDVICFEIAFAPIVSAATRAGAQLLVVQTNNSTYGFTKQPEQQLAITRFRAIEQQRAVLVAATSGVSAAISSRGEVLERTPEFEPAVVQQELELRTGITLANYLSIVVQGLATGFIAFLIRRNRLATRRLSK